MSLIITPTYTWTDGDVVTATRLNTAPTIADGQAAVFSTITASGNVTLGATGTGTNTEQLVLDGGSGSGGGGAIYFRRNSVSKGQVGNESAILGGTSDNLAIYANAGGSIDFFANGSSTAVGTISSTGFAVTGALSASNGATITGALSASGELTFGGAITRVTSNFTVSATTTLANVTGLTFTVAAGGVYYLRANLGLSQAGNGGYGVGIGGTATATSFYANVNYQGLTINNCKFSPVSSLGNSATYNLTGFDSASASIEGTIVVNAGGTLTVQFAQNSATSTSTVLAGSTFSIRRIS